MSEQDNNGVNTVSPTEQNLVPKERLDELIAQRNQLAQQTQVLQDLLRRAVPSPQAQQVPEQESEQMQRLKEENPAVYLMLKQEQQEKRRMGATLFQIMDNQDQQQLINEFGEDAKNYLPQVEAKLQELREKGIHSYNRGQIYVHLKGLETISKPKAKQPTVQAQAAPTQAPAPSLDNFPSSDPRSASTTVASSASPRTSTSTLEELEDRLKDVVI